MPVFTDQAGQTVILEQIPRRIVSLVPSQTELLYDLGLNDEVVGITKFCVHPDSWFRAKTRVGGTKQLKTDIIRQLQPDLIIANKEENVKEQIEALQENFPVWISDVNSLQDAGDMIQEIGRITGKAEKANELVQQINKNFSRLQTPDYRLRTIYLIWQNPYMTVGSDTFIHSMMKAAGFENMFANEKRYPEITLEQLKDPDCELILLSSEPFPFKEKHREELKAQGVKAQVMLADGEMFSWYGSRLLKAPEYFQSLHDRLEEF